MSQFATSGALEYCARIRDLILHHSGGWADADALRDFRLLSSAVAREADDHQCAELVSSAEHYAADLFSESAHYKWARANTSGADILRLCIFGKLHVLRERLLILEAERQWPLASEESSDRRP